MNQQSPGSKPTRPDESVLRTFVLLAGAALVAGGLIVLARALYDSNISALTRLDGAALAALAALVLGAGCLVWGVRRRRERAPASEEALSKLVRKYEREGRTQELEDAREQLIQLLVEKDERESPARK